MADVTQDNDLIDVTLVLKFIFNARKAIFLSCLVCVLTSSIYFFFYHYHCSYQMLLKPISPFDNELYYENNTKDYYKINHTKLYNLFIRYATDPDKLRETISQTNLSQSSQDKLKIFSNIIFKPEYSVEDGKKIETGRMFFSYNTHDALDAKNTMKKIMVAINEKVRLHVIEEYERFLASHQDSNEMNKEDLVQDMNNLLDDYKRETADRLEFLSEQAAIAHALNISKNTLESQDYIVKDNHILTSLKVDQPYYFHGYISIDKEIELLKSRKNERAFIKELYSKEKALRAIKQDKLLARSKKLLAETPLYSKENFKSIYLQSLSNDKLEKVTNFNGIYFYIFCSIFLGIFFGLLIHLYNENKSQFFDQLT